MATETMEAALGRRPFALLVRNVRIVNVFDGSILPGCIGIAGGRIALLGEEDSSLRAEREVDGRGRYALPGFVDSHMHLESSMLTPAHFARLALSCGTTSVAADPHEICNVLGVPGVAALAQACAGLPLRILLTAPSTVPSAPGLEGSGAEVGPEETERLLDLPGVCGLGEVMDFNGVADGGEHILSVAEAARRRGVFLDGHASVLTGRRLQVFRAAGIDSDHTVASAAKLREELALGFTVQVQECVLNAELVRAMDEAPVQDRICLVTDDVSLPRLMRRGHLNSVLARAVDLGLDPVRAIRYATVNPARRLRLYDVGGIAPGMAADLQLVDDLRAPRPSLVVCGGRIVWEEGRFTAELPRSPLSGALRGTVRLRPQTAADFAVTCPVREGFRGGTARVNLIAVDGATTRTRREQTELPLHAAGPGLAEAETGPYCKMAVCNRYGLDRRGLALLSGMDGVTGAAALTYGHDSHNLSVFGRNGGDMAAAANAVREAGGGLCAVRDGRVTTLVPLPLAGLLSEEEPEALLPRLEAFLEDCRRMGFRHENLLAFFTIMPLAVSPEIKCTDLGPVDASHRRLLPLIEEIKEISDGT